MNEQRRRKLHDILEGIPGVTEAYFDPPSNVQMKYPCIRYRLAGDDAVHADNILYTRRDRYELTVIDRRPSSPIPALVRQLPYCSFDRPYTAEGLNHFVFTIYF